ncbi:M23 family metallopeptidase [Microbacterium sp. SORGH_AS_0888]|uniref:M23 family metallopeptidase n=1 Tax=Microbacterium sp. SORGH_AS_0888 TaxID=3041791 RepID=UPI00278B6CB5|nr:M23 family metallopeptidase [Microbacterium sp. SORGH_AS_0888]MDQ1130183.1 murein DD-endopeptidase MepM/ murein hydrolase activator NlpD [Microbacterium sp. SORGH_AS_0888]
MRDHIDPTEECDCAPSGRERRTMWSAVDRRTALGIGAFGAIALAGVGASVVSSSSSAFAIEGYPSWDDVQAAKANEAAKASEIARIQQLISDLQADVANKQAIAKQKSDEFFAAQQAFFDAGVTADQLQSQADQQSSKAVDAANKAGRVAAQLYRSGGDGTSLQLFLAGSAASADDLLARLGTMDKLLERNQAVYADAVTARNSAQSLTDKAKVARDERDRLQKAADAAMQDAQQAAQAAEDALAAQNANLGTLQAQLAALQDDTAKTVADYQAGVEEQKRRDAAAAAAAAAAAEAARQAAAAAAAANSGGGGGGGDSGGGGGGGGDWVRPSGGGVSSNYGQRYGQCGPDYCASSFHYGVDLAPGCWGDIYAAHSGTVVYAGYNGGYGNYIKIDHGDGTGSGYAHIVDGGIYVGRGQWVSAGQRIASVGNTGNSFGCHLHFEVYVGSSIVNPQVFMQQHGVWIGYE